MAHAWPLSAGDRVTVRGERWVVQEATAFGDATLLDSRSADDRHTHRRCCLLSPFDRPVATRRSPRNPRDDAAAVDASPACASVRGSHVRRVASASARRDRHPSVPARACARARSRTRVAISARRRSRAWQDDSSRADARGTAPARLVRARAHRHAGRAAAAVGRRAAAPIRHARGGHRRRVARGARRFAAVRREPVDRRAGRASRRSTFIKQPEVLRGLAARSGTC